MSCMLLHPMHCLPVANEIVRRDLKVDPAIDSLPRRKRVRALVSAMFADNVTAFRHRYANNANALAEADNFEKVAGKAFSASRTTASPEVVFSLARSWSYQTSDHADADKLPTMAAVRTLTDAILKEAGKDDAGFCASPAYQQASRGFWTATPDTIKPLIDEAARVRAERKAGRPAKATAATSNADLLAQAISLGEGERLLRSLVSDVEAMLSGVQVERGDGSESEGFGPFAAYDENKHGVIVAWPNLRITLEAAFKYLEGQRALSLAPAAAPETTSMAAFVSRMVGKAA